MTSQVPGAAQASAFAAERVRPVARDALPPAAPQSATGDQRPGPLATDTVVLLLVDFAPAARLWGWSRLVRGAAALRREAGLRWCKVLGSGHDGGFGLKPSGTRQGLFCVFDTDANARAFIDRSPIVHAYRHRAREFASLRLAPFSCRGAWNGRTVTPSIVSPLAAPGAESPAYQGPIAALTRGSIRPAAAAAFWKYTPASQAALEGTRGCLLAVGLGEAPVFRQATFSVWESLAHMDAYARHGAHRDAARAAADHRFFTESMFVRFVPLSMQGTWKGRHHALG